MTFCSAKYREPVHSMLKAILDVANGLLMRNRKLIIAESQPTRKLRIN